MTNGPYVLDAGIYRRPGVMHRDDEYDSQAFDILRQMQARHFWYQGRHRFLWSIFHGVLRTQRKHMDDLRVVDLGGGCGGWIQYMLDKHRVRPCEIALGDSSIRALEYAADVLPSTVSRYQIDLLGLEWEERWDVAFLLDVLEHLPDDRKVLHEVWKSLAPGGVLFITTPAFNCFWSYNDVLAHHVRRYQKSDYENLAAATAFKLLDVRYFMFFLSPLLIASRLFANVNLERTTADEKQSLLSKTHRVPNVIVNTVLSAVFAAETPIGKWLRFPWGTSVLVALQKPTKHD
jgi:2-polyprenyl-3-methyl-5-hydroxy-6-metoxy-1,4-benzoquinol methylase